MDYERIIFSGHALRQMFSRGLKKDDCIAIVRQGEVIMDYPDDKPYPSCLMLGFVGDMPVHVVLAVNVQARTGIIITAYIPDPKIWADDFRTRRT
jgi:hypothetical protein